MVMVVTSGYGWLCGCTWGLQVVIGIYGVFRGSKTKRWLRMVTDSHYRWLGMVTVVYEWLRMVTGSYGVIMITMVKVTMMEVTIIVVTTVEVTRVEVTTVHVNKTEVIMLDVIKILVIIVEIIRVEVTMITNVVKDKLGQKNKNTKRKFTGVRRLPNKFQ